MIHPSADVAADARIGDRTKVWNWVQIREGAVIGDDCIIGKSVYVDRGVRIGDRVKIQNGALVCHGATVEAGVFIGPGVILTNDRYPRAVTPDGELATDADWTLDEVHLGYGCSIGANAVIVAGSDVGRYATVGAGAVVTRPVPDYALVAGQPARRIGWVCACGRRLVESYGHGECTFDGRRYQIRADVCEPDPAQLAAR